MTTPYLDRLRELAKAATPGPWKSPYGHSVYQEQEDCIHICVTRDDEYIENRNEHDAFFIAESRTSIPRLVEALEVAIEGLHFYSNQHNYTFRKIPSPFLGSQKRTMANPIVLQKKSTVAVAALARINGILEGKG